MSIFKRPPLRRKVETISVRLKPGDPLYERIHPPIDTVQVQQKIPVYHQKEYLKLLEKNYKYYGLPMKDLKLPTVTEYVKPFEQKEPDIEFYDRIYVMTSILKSGKVKIKINTGMYDLYEKYYRYNKQPPQKGVLKVYKSLGFSDAFLKRVEASYKKIPSRVIAFQKCIDKVFNKPSVSKAKKKKVEPEPEVDPEDLIKVDVVEDEDDNDDDDPGEDGEMDVEVEVDEVEEYGEEYINDD
jgi:hypothetical protein